MRSAERLAVTAPLCGDMEASLSARIGLRGKADTLGDECLRDLGKAVVLRADQVGRRHGSVNVGQLCGVRRTPTHLVQLAADLKTGSAAFHYQQRNTCSANAAGACRGDDVVGAHTGGDVGLGAANVGRTNFSISRASPDVADDHRVGAVSAAAAGYLGKARSQQPGRARAPAQLARQLTDALPFVDVGQDLSLGEGTHRLAELVTLGRGPDTHSTPSGMSTWRLRSHSPSPLAWGSKRAW